MFKRSSRHRPKGKFIRIRRGLALYQTPCQSLLLRPHSGYPLSIQGSLTKETSRVEARKAAEELAAKICAPDAPALGQEALLPATQVQRPAPNSGSDLSLACGPVT
jgi:hypothetical protein